MTATPSASPTSTSPGKRVGCDGSECRFTYERTENFAEVAERHGLVVWRISERDAAGARAVTVVEGLFDFLK